MTFEITVLGMVQGIGFRPFVARMAEKLHITGSVRNSGGIVKIIATANPEAMDIFVHRLSSRPPSFAQIIKVTCVPLPDQAFDGFRIIESDADMRQTPLIPADLPMCEKCHAELTDPQNRRYRYPFISCTACGPRYSIIEGLPYDRETTTMADFPMCPVCTEEYTGSGRRRHAQTISCHDCGPQLILCAETDTYEKEAALTRAIDLLNEGTVLAIKGVGGYQFACLPTNEDAVKKLRLLKQRDKKPFAVMFADIETIRDACHVSADEQALLMSPARPIVLLDKTKEIFCDLVSGASRKLGAFLPYTPLHQLLTDACGPLIMTSGNISSQPIITQDKDMLSLSSPHLDGVLYNTREIRVPLDDSVARVTCGTVQSIRRSRGYVPLPVLLPSALSYPVLATGGDLKACFCLAAGDRAYLSQYLGDMEQYGVQQNYCDNLNHMEELFHIAPQKIVCDMHPVYHSTTIAEKIAKERNIPLVRVQHHHAHILSVMAEHNIPACIGVAFDGTGYGTDGTVWGGEFLLCQGKAVQRAGYLQPIALTGGDNIAQDASLNALCHLHACSLSSDDSHFETVGSAIRAHVNTSQSSSMGRLFDAVSALLDLKCYNSYEGECAIALENCAYEAQQQGVVPYPLPLGFVEKDGVFVIDRQPLIRELVRVRQHTDVRALALGFHHAVAAVTLEVCRAIRVNTNEKRVALSGGVFANELLLKQCISLLEKDGFSVCINSAVPCNDGGISLGQAYFAALSERQ
ncbi:MAG: carbamoyltransferase HypF [Christensenella sp.]|uniref:carbamoyltransferase HypF n=1 Tax=Christensenella sp. TaxID=1935934 RepID=UPI002B20B297|nr:carbamoyltransferase HypF [Christensenella sp.]MEA5004047.1 carbamoyltransferase HypF [Christensenella sp.]